MAQNARNSTPVPGPHGFGGGAGQKVNRLETGKGNAGLSNDAQNEEEDDDLGPFSYCDVIEVRLNKLLKTTEALQKFCLENRNVHLQVKTWAKDLLSQCKSFNPDLAKLRNSVHKIDRELSEVSMAERLRSFDESSISAPKLYKVAEAATQVEMLQPATKSDAAVQASPTALVEVRVKPALVPEALHENRKTDGPAKNHKSKKNKVSTQESHWNEVKGKRKPHSRLPPGKLKSVTRQKPPAVLIRVTANSSYADTVRALRGSGGINPSDYGANVTCMRQTRDGHLLVELDKGAQSGTAAGKLGAAIRDKLGDRVGSVSQLGHAVEIIITDIDAAATKEEVIEAVRSAIPGEPGDQAALTEREAVSLTGLWETRAGQQMASLRLPRSAVATMKKVKIGWTICKIRERRPPPTRCFRCHGYGHSSGSCQGPDLSVACRRCGKVGHSEKACKEGEDRCVACDRLGAPRKAHKPGSGACAARRAAFRTQNGTPDRRAP